jgi:hypothetical protein
MVRFLLQEFITILTFPCLAKRVFFCCFIFFCFSCSHAGKQYVIQKEYDASSGNNAYEIVLDKSKDTIKVQYTFVLNHGKFSELIDDAIDSSDYAGFFKTENIIQNSVKFKIRDYVSDYHSPDEKDEKYNSYDLNVTFLSDSSLKWHIDSSRYQPFWRLPTDMVFKARGH